MSTFVVLGARGGTGAQLVHKLVARPDVKEVRSVVRDPAKVEAGTMPDDPKCKVVGGDVTDVESLQAIFAGATVVINATSGRSFEQCLAVDQVAVGATAKLALEAGVQRYVLVSSQLVHPANTWKFVRLILNNVITGFKAPWSSKPGMMDMKFQGEQLLRASGVPYTIVRPGRLVDGPLDATPFAGQTNSHFMKGAASTRADVAAVCILAAEDERTRNCTFELASDATKPGAKDGSMRGEPV